LVTKNVTGKKFWIAKQIRGWEKAELFLCKLQHLRRMGSESIFIFIHKLSAEKKPVFIFYAPIPLPLNKEAELPIK
jgi:hypothetical protein